MTVAAPSVMPDGPAVRVGSDDRTAAILPAPARAGLRMDCQGSSDEIVQRGLPCRRSGNWRANRRLPLERMRISPAGLVRPRRAGRRNRARNAEAHRDRRADLQPALGPVVFERDEARRHRLRMTARGAFGQHATFASIIRQAVSKLLSRMRLRSTSPATMPTSIKPACAARTMSGLTRSCMSIVTCG